MTDIVRALSLGVTLIIVGFALIFLGDIEGLGRWAAVIAVMCGAILVGLAFSAMYDGHGQQKKDRL